MGMFMIFIVLIVNRGILLPKFTKLYTLCAAVHFLYVNYTYE